MWVLGFGVGGWGLGWTEVEFGGVVREAVHPTNISTPLASTNAIPPSESPLHTRQIKKKLYKRFSFGVGAYLIATMCECACALTCMPSLGAAGLWW